MSTVQRWALAATMGLCWGVVAVASAALLHEGIWSWSGVISTPVIGLLAATATGLWRRSGIGGRVTISLIAVYVTAALFTIGGELAHVALGGHSPRLVDVTFGVVMALWAITITGLVLVYWPLAYFTYWIFDRVDEVRGNVAASASPHRR